MRLSSTKKVKRGCCLPIHFPFQRKGSPFYSRITLLPRTQLFPVPQRSAAPWYPRTQLLSFFYHHLATTINSAKKPDSSSRVIVYYFHFLPLPIPSSVWPLPRAPTETALAGDQWSLWLGQGNPFQTRSYLTSAVSGTMILILSNVLSTSCGSSASWFSSCF